MALSEDYAWHYLKTIKINAIKDDRIFRSVRDKYYIDSDVFLADILVLVDSWYFYLIF